MDDIISVVTGHWLTHIVTRIIQHQYLILLTLRLKLYLILGYQILLQKQLINIANCGFYYILLGKFRLVASHCLCYLQFRRL